MRGYMISLLIIISHVQIEVCCYIFSIFAVYVCMVHTDVKGSNDGD